MSLGPLLILCTVRARQPLTLTLSPRPLTLPCVRLARVTTCLWTQLRLFMYCLWLPLCCKVRAE